MAARDVVKLDERRTNSDSVAASLSKPLNLFTTRISVGVSVGGRQTESTAVSFPQND
jgi:hypothetical protein